MISYVLFLQRPSIHTVLLDDFFTHALAHEHHQSGALKTASQQASRLCAWRRFLNLQRNEHNNGNEEHEDEDDDVTKIEVDIGGAEVVTSVLRQLEFVSDADLWRRWRVEYTGEGMLSMRLTIISFSATPHTHTTHITIIFLSCQIHTHTSHTSQYGSINVLSFAFRCACLCL